MQIKYILLIMLLFFGVILLLNILQLFKARFFPDKYYKQKFLALKNEPAIFAHRGKSEDYLENSLDSIINALNQGADGLEIDIRLTKDNQIVAFHDEDLNRLTGIDEKIRNLTLEELKDIDLLVEEEKGENRRGNKIKCKIASLKEILNQFMPIPLIIELKDEQEELIKELASLINHSDITDNILLGSFDYKTIKRTREEISAVPTTASKKEAIIFYLLAHLGIAGWLDWDFKAFSLPTYYLGLPVLTPIFRTAARAAGIKIFIWTINDPQEFQRLAKMEVHGIMTDYPEKMAKKF